MIQTYLKDRFFLKLLFKYNGAEQSETEFLAQYAGWLKQLKSQRFLISIAGVQGVGKSTFLNALTHKHPVLPIDANETTCVPVEIEYGADSSRKAHVHFKNGQIKETDCTEEGLMRYVHNEQNPGNRDGISHIVVRSPAPFLKNGLVLVDLPGVGSLTKENLETTRKYLLESTAVLFLLRTVPPITKSDAIFIASVWPQIPTTLFVQNRWVDEGKEEVADGKEDNQQKLRTIAKRARIPLQDGEPHIHVVQANMAWEGSLTGEKTLWDKSGLTLILDKLSDLGERWPKVLKDQIIQSLLFQIKLAQDKVESLMQATEKSREELRAEEKKEKELFREYESKQREECERLRGLVETCVQDYQSKLNTWAKEQNSRIRNTMRSKMRGGIVDGPRLSIALEDEQKESMDILNDEIQELVFDIQDKILSCDIPSWESTKGSHFVGVDVKEAIKGENLLAPAGNAIGGLGGMAVGAKAGALLGAKLGVAGGPVGMAIGVACGALGGIIGGWLLGTAGKKGRDYYTEEIRAKNAETVVFPAIDTFISNVKKEYGKLIQGYQQAVDQSIESWGTSQKQTFQKEQDARKKIRRLSEDEKVKHRASLLKDKQTLEEVIQTLESK